jgi:hypothetical protein
MLADRFSLLTHQLCLVSVIQSSTLWQLCCRCSYLPLANITTQAPHRESCSVDTSPSKNAQDDVTASFLNPPGPYGGMRIAAAILCPGCLDGGHASAGCRRGANTPAGAARGFKPMAHRLQRAPAVDRCDKQDALEAARCWSSTSNKLQGQISHESDTFEQVLSAPSLKVVCCHSAERCCCMPAWWGQRFKVVSVQARRQPSALTALTALWTAPRTPLPPPQLRPGCTACRRGGS